MTLYPNVGELVAVRLPYWWDFATPRDRVRPAPAPSGNSHDSRAKTKVRRLVMEHEMRVLGTLTYAVEPASRREVDQHVHEWLIRMRKQFGHLPIVAVIEEGTLRGRFHVHFALPHRLPLPKVYGAWRRGYVFLSDKKKHAAAQRRGPKGIAAYLGKYVAKSVDAASSECPRGRARNAPRYHVTRGCQPVRKRRRFRSEGAVLSWAEAYYGVGGKPYRFGDWEGNGVCGFVIRYYDDVREAWQHPGPEWFGISGTAAP